MGKKRVKQRKIYRVLLSLYFVWKCLLYCFLFTFRWLLFSLGFLLNSSKPVNPGLFIPCAQGLNTKIVIFIELKK